MDEYTDEQIGEWTREDLLNSPLLSPEEIEQLRKQKYELTQYAKEKLKKMNENKTLTAKVSAEDYQKVVNALDEREQLANTEKNSMTEDARIRAIQTAVGFINQHSEELKELAKTEKEELKAELEKLKKENFQKLADACMEEYEKKYHRDVFPVDEHWVYMIAEYYGTGEGQTTCVMMTQASPYGDDFADGNFYVPINSQQYRAVRKFHEKFGTWMLCGLKFLSKEDFFGECAYFLPPVMMKLSNSKCMKEFYTEVHYNFS